MTLSVPPTRTPDALLFNVAQSRRYHARRLQRATTLDRLASMARAGLALALVATLAAERHTGSLLLGWTLFMLVVVDHAARFAEKVAVHQAYLRDFADLQAKMSRHASLDGDAFTRALERFEQLTGREPIRAQGANEAARDEEARARGMTLGAEPRHAGFV